MHIFEEEVSERQVDAFIQKLTGKTVEELRQDGIIRDIYYAANHGKSVSTLALLDCLLMARGVPVLPNPSLAKPGSPASQFLKTALFKKHEGGMKPWNDTADTVCHSFNKRQPRTIHPSTWSPHEHQ